ncbi:MAG TPA: sigma-70 family RNA polymerase sigma factor [Thermoanaerobaculia bacterium]|jgi:RNA polymerase sigma-70 factor (ECF subfamily)
MASPETDRALVSRIERRDADALALLYDRYAARLNGLAARILGGTGEAEEVLQDVFLYVWRSASTYDGARGTVLSWLVVATRSRAIDRLRVRKPGGRERLRPLEEAPEPESPDDPSAGAEGRQWEELCREAVGELPPDQRQALELAYFDGLTQQEIAERTKTPLGTVKTRMRLGMMKLRERIRPYLSVGRDAS